MVEILDVLGRNSVVSTQALELVTWFCPSTFHSMRMPQIRNLVNLHEDSDKMLRTRNRQVRYVLLTTGTFIAQINISLILKFNTQYFLHKILTSGSVPIFFLISTGYTILRGKSSSWLDAKWGSFVMTVTACMEAWFIVLHVRGQFHLRRYEQSHIMASQIFGCSYSSHSISNLYSRWYD